MLQTSGDDLMLEKKIIKGKRYKGQGGESIVRGEIRDRRDADGLKG